MARRKELQIPDAILDQLLSGTAASAAFDQGRLLDLKLKLPHFHGRSVGSDQSFMSIFLASYSMGER